MTQRSFSGMVSDARKYLMGSKSLVLDHQLLIAGGVPHVNDEVKPERINMST